MGANISVYALTNPFRLSDSAVSNSAVLPDDDVLLCVGRRRSAEKRLLLGGASSAYTEGSVPVSLDIVEAPRFEHLERMATLDMPLGL